MGQHAVGTTGHLARGADPVAVSQQLAGLPSGSVRVLVHVCGHPGLLHIWKHVATVDISFTG